MVIDRTKNTIKGTLWGIISKFVSLFFPFIIRTIFIKTLGPEYLGLNSLFVSILQVLNLAELGVGSALVFSMYKPIAEGDKEKICALMNLYRKYYRIIGLVVLCAGIIIAPFLPLLIRGEVPADINLYVLYFMQLSATVLSYWLFSYKNSLFQAHQRVDVISIITTIVYIFQYITQIFVLIVSKNYYLFLTVTIISQILINIVTYLVSLKYYHDYIPKGKLERADVKIINQKLRDLVTVKISDVISNSFDTIVVSSFLGLSALAIFQNYYYIISAIIGFLLTFFVAIQAGVGNFLITRSGDESYFLLKSINFVVFFLINICCCCFITVCQPFMIVWVGEKYLLDNSLVLMYAFYLCAYIMIRPLVLFKDAAGMWRQDRFRPLTSALVNLGLNLLTVRWIGLYGILGSTIVSYLFISFPWVLFNINKYMFKIKVKRFILKDLLYLLIIALSCYACIFLCGLIDLPNHYIEIVVYLLISVSISTLFFVLFFSRTAEFSFCINKLRFF